MHLIHPWDRSALNRRILIAIVVAWVPLVAINLFRILVRHDAVGFSFFQDIGVNARMLLALPLLIAGEYLILPRLETIAAYLRESLVVREDPPRFDDILNRARKSDASVCRRLQERRGDLPSQRCCRLYRSGSARCRSTTYCKR